MNFRDQVLILGFILVVVILVSLGSSGVVMPYSPYMFDAHYSSYEGMEDSIPSMGAIPTGKAPAPEEVTGPDYNKPKKTEGFQGLQGSPFGKEPTLDIYSSLSGSAQCKPSPYSNSKGYLCLDKVSNDMLNTRGGNAAGVPSEIGH